MERGNGRRALIRTGRRVLADLGERDPDDTAPAPGIGPPRGHDPGTIPGRAGCPVPPGVLDARAGVRAIPARSGGTGPTPAPGTGRSGTAARTGGGTDGRQSRLATRAPRSLM